MTPRMSETLKLEYLMYFRDLEEMRVMVDEIPMPGGRFGLLERMVAATGAKAPIQRFCLRASNDVERSRRAARLLFANWLAQVDKPATKRAAIAISKPTLIYATDPTAPPAARAVDPDVLNMAIDHTALAREMFRPAAFSSVNGTPMSRAPVGRGWTLGAGNPSSCRAHRQAGRRAFSPRAHQASGNGRRSRRDVSQGPSGGNRKR